MEFTKEEITQIYFMKKNFPEVAKVCAHFITRACLFGDTCREKHDLKVKNQIITLIKTQRLNKEKDASKEEVKSQTEALPKKKGIDLRDTVLA